MAMQYNCYNWQQKCCELEGHPLSINQFSDGLIFFVFTGKMSFMASGIKSH